MLALALSDPFAAVAKSATHHSPSKPAILRPMYRPEKGSSRRIMIEEVRAVRAKLMLEP
jgi:hypothetical protein